MKFLIEKLENIARGQRWHHLRYSSLTGPCTRALYEWYETRIERQEASRLVQSFRDCNFLESEQLRRTFEYAAEEANELCIQDQSKVCFVGSGYLPESAIAITQKIGCHVHCVEKNIKAVHLSKGVIKNLHLEDRITVLHGDGRTFNFEKYDAVWVAVLAKQKNKIIEQILASSPHAKIACRTVQGMRMLLYSPLDEKKLLAKIQKRIFPSNPCTIMHSLILTA